MTNTLLAPRLPAPHTTPRPTRGAPVCQASVIVNASKVSGAALERFRRDVDAAFVEQGWLPPLWHETTAETRGAEEARLAVAAGVDVVLVAGGDGTVRTVAQELAGTDLPLALLPLGTGNLLARNLGIPRHDVAAAVAVACGDGVRRIDVGWLELEPAGPTRPGAAGGRYAFLVMAGVGFDAATMAGAGHALKARLGPAAYLVSGVRAIQRAMTPTTVTVDGRSRRVGRSRGVVVGNFGALTMGLSLMPEAEPDDGMLDGVVFLQRTVLDWARVAWAVATRRRGGRLMPRVRGSIVEVHTGTPQPVEVDGDVIGEATSLRFETQRCALLVRCGG